MGLSIYVGEQLEDWDGLTGNGWKDELYHEMWCSSYTHFDQWRNCIARAGGYQVARVMYEEFHGIPYWSPLVDWGHLGNHARLSGIWEYKPMDPLMYLIVHYDSDGEFNTYQAKALLPRMKQIRDDINWVENLDYLWQHHDTATSHDRKIEIAEAYAQRTDQFIEGLEKAVEWNTIITFS